MRKVLCVIFAALVPGASNADCSQAFDVDATKSVTVMGWLPGSKEAGVTILKCKDLEAAREQYFVENAGLIKPEALASAEAYQSAVADTLKRLDRANVDLQSKLDSDATLDALIITWRVLKFEFAKVSTLIGCVAPEPTASKLLCAGGIASLVDDFSNIADGSITKTQISKRAQELKKQTADLKKRYEDLRKNAAKFDMPFATKQRTSIFLAMCTAVQQQCLN